MKPPFFRLRRTRLNGIISPPYPELTLDTGFPVGGRLAARRTVSWPRLPKVALRQTRLNGIITSPYPEVNLDTFGFPVGAHSAVRQAVVMAPIAENYHFWAKNAYYSIVSHCIVWYCMELNFILWYCICYNHDGTPKRQL